MPRSVSAWSAALPDCWNLTLNGNAITPWNSVCEINELATWRGWNSDPSEMPCDDYPWFKTITVDFQLNAEMKFAALLIFATTLAARASTITGILLDLTGTATDTTIYFRSVSTPYAEGLNVVIAGSTKVTTTGGAFSVTLKQGDYQVSSDRLNGFIRVPNDSETYNINAVWGRFTVWGGAGNISAKTASYTVVTGDSGKTITNTGASGAVTNTLPTAAAGLQYGFIITAAQTLQIKASGTDTIRIGTTVSAAAGFAETNVVGTAITLLSTASGSWIATSTVASWAVQ